MATLACDVRGRLAVVALERGIRAALDEQPRQLGMAVVDREEDRRDVVRGGTEQRAVFVEQRGDGGGVVVADGGEELVCLHRPFLRDYFSLVNSARKNAAVLSSR